MPGPAVSYSIILFIMKTKSIILIYKKDHTFGYIYDEAIKVGSGEIKMKQKRPRIKHSGTL